MDWTRDNKQYDNFLVGKKRYLMIFNYALRTTAEAAKCEYLKYKMGTKGLQLIEKWETTGRIQYEAAEE